MKKLLATLMVTGIVSGAALAQQKGAVFQFQDAEATYDFGTVKEGAKVEHDYVFKNVGDQPLQILRVDASCGCTTPEWPKRPIMPGKTEKIKVTFNSAGNVGKTIKEISIQSNAVLPDKNKRRYTLTLKGEVVK
ncbi:MAG TPA: DUF1573 domain-containing protein [Edaphocola sp.]|nr:DUF1573 domain-containing protein [Edaphocola sp.]